MTDRKGYMTARVGREAEVDVPYAAIATGSRRNCVYRSGVPRKPYRSPRDWLPAHQRRLFGGPMPESLDWHTPETELEEALLDAAKAQSNLAFRIRTSGYYVPTATIAAEADLHPDTVRDILNGSKHASLAALFALTAAVGRDLTVTSAHRPRPSEGSDPT